MDTTDNLGLPYLAAAQAQKHVTHNEALRALDALVHLMVLDKDLSAPPGSPTAGDRYIVGAGPTGAWSGQAGNDRRLAGRRLGLPFPARGLARLDRRRGPALRLARRRLGAAPRRLRQGTGILDSAGQRSSSSSTPRRRRRQPASASPTPPPAPPPALAAAGDRPQHRPPPRRQGHGRGAQRWAAGGVEWGVSATLCRTHNGQHKHATEPTKTTGRHLR